jgi:hypothetical protein
MPDVRGSAKMTILAANLLFNTLIFWIAARIYLVPRLAELSPQIVLIPTSA